MLGDAWSTLFPAWRAASGEEAPPEVQAVAETNTTAVATTP